VTYWSQGSEVVVLTVGRTSSWSQEFLWRTSLGKFQLEKLEGEERKTSWWILGI
jgi:hypothetical protein